MRNKLSKKKLFLCVIIYLIAFEIILQIAGFVLTLNVKKQATAKGGDFNILCIGDSFTYGLGAPKQESYPLQLEQVLNKSYPDSRIKVINLGFPGYNSSQCLKRLKEKFDLYHPKIIMVMAGMNNRWSFVDSSYFKIKQAQESNSSDFKAKSIDASLSKLKTYKLIKIAFVNVIGKLKQGKAHSYVELSLPDMVFQMPARSDKLMALLKRGVNYFEEGQYDLSEICYREALRLSPTDYEPHWYMGRFYIYKGQTQKAREELILAAKYAPHPYALACIICDLQDQSRPTDSEHFKEYTGLIKQLRGYWVQKFGEEYVHSYVDPMISCETDDFVRVLVYDFSEMANYAKQRGTKLVVLAYPHPATKFRCPLDIYYRICEQLNLPLVDNVVIFDKYLETYRLEELFSTDGHCTGKGYGIIAKNAATVLEKYGLLAYNN